MVKYHNHIATIPLGIFVDCYCDGDLRKLVIEGDPSDGELQQAWDDIQSQFAYEMGDTQLRTYLGLLKEVNTAIANINSATTLIGVMEHAYHPDLGRMLNRILKAGLIWPENDRTIINANLKRCVSLIKPLQMRLTIKKQAMEVMEAKMAQSGTGGKPGRQYFDVLLNLVEEHFSVPVDYSILTSRFCDKVKRMNKQLKTINSKIGKK